MPKAKTHKGMAKRFKLSKKGKVKADKAHYKMRKRSGKQTRQDRKGLALTGTLAERIRKALHR